MRAGVYLRWFIDPQLGFPPLGFDVFRRVHRPGSPKEIDFTSEPERELPRSVQLGTTTWSTGSDIWTARFRSETTDQGVQTVLEPPPPGNSAITCRFAAADGPVRRVELDVAHWGPRLPNHAPVELGLWGIARGERVARGNITLTHQNYKTVLRVAVTADALDGFQLGELGQPGRYFGILRVRWVTVADEAELDWGAPLNARRIGFPVTAPGYLVPHAHSPDPGTGAADWQEAADRLSPTGAAAQLPAALQQRFGPPVFDGTRELMRKALARESVVGGAGSVGDPRIALDAVRLLLLASVDPNFARLAGLAWFDGSAAANQAYDYKVVGYWPGPLRPQLVCFEVPAGGGTVPAGGTITIGGGSGGTPVVVTSTGPTTTTGPTPRTVARLGPSVALPRDLDPAAVPGVILAEATAGQETLTADSTPTVVTGPDGLVSTGPTLGAGPGGVVPPAARRSLTFTFAEATDTVRVVGLSGGPDPLAVMALAGTTVVAVRTAPAGQPADLTLNAPGTTSVVVSGTGLTVTTICRMQLVQELIRETWISFGLILGPVARPTAPERPDGQVLPAFAKDGRPETAVGVTLAPRPPPPAPWQLLPRARGRDDPVIYEVSRRANGDQPNQDPAAGTWTPVSENAAPGAVRAPAHKAPPGWPIEPQSLIDTGIDPEVRYYSYRTRGRDLFGRLSDWSPTLSVDAADRVAPPPPDAVTSRWIELGDPWLASDDRALLEQAGATSGVRLRWSWPSARQEQAPDTSAFRVYWNEAPFSTMQATIDSVQSGTATYLVQLRFDRLGADPPAGAFAGDWLRQGTHRYRVVSSTATRPTTLTVSATDVPPPVAGRCVVSLRAPDPKRLDLLGNPLRPDASSPLVWDERVLEVPLLSVSGLVSNVSAGVPVEIAAVDVHDGTATVTLAPDWVWAGVVPESADLVGDGRAVYPIVGGTLGATAALVVDLEGGDPPKSGKALLRARDGLPISTVTTDADLRDPNGVRLLGGIIHFDTAAGPAMVLAHRVDRALLAVVSQAAAGSFSWLPDYEALLTGVTLDVSAAEPHATGVTGVSAVDGRSYIPDRRQRQGEPGGPGNEGPVVDVSVTREYRGTPTVQAQPEGTSVVPGTNAPGDLWAPMPDEFSGNASYMLRWPSAGASRFAVYHATLDAVLDSAAADRGAARGAYAGQQPISGAALAQWRAQQAALGPAALQQLATQQETAFLPLTPQPLESDSVPDPQSGWLRWPAPLDGSAPGRHFLRARAVDEAGNEGPPGPATLPIVVPDGRRPPAPSLRRAVEGDRQVWLQWDAAAGAGEYRVHRSQLPAGSRPDVRDMTLLATLADNRCPQPVSVFAGEARLPGDAPSSLVAVYRAEHYDATLGPGTQTATPLPGPPTLVNGVVGGLGTLADGSLVFAVVRYTAGGPPTLAAAATGRAYRDATLEPGKRYQYRVVAVRQAAVGPSQTVSVRSFPSEVVEAEAFDARPPQPPQGSAAWNAGQQAVAVSWTTTGLPPGLELLVQRTEQSIDMWRSVTAWLPASTGSAFDATAASGTTYLYRLRVRTAAGGVSVDEPQLGPVAVP